MTKILNITRESIPSLRFIGKKYTNKDRKDETFAHLWEKWFEEGTFRKIDISNTHFNLENYFNTPIGLMRANDNEFEYWIGMFVPVNIRVPKDFDNLIFNNTEVMTFQIKGTEPDIYFDESTCFEILKLMNLKLKEFDGLKVFYERYSMPKFKLDDNNERILDFCMIIEDDE